MTEPKFTISQGDHGDEIFEGETKLAFTNASGSLQFTRGNGDRREEVEAWIKRHEAHTAAAEAPVGAAATSVEEVPSEHNKAVAENTVLDQTTNRAPVDPIICPIVGASHLGDKDPAVYNWWFKNHPEMAKNRYAGRRVQTESGIIV